MLFPELLREKEFSDQTKLFSNVLFQYVQAHASSALSWQVLMKYCLYIQFKCRLINLNSLSSLLQSDNSSHFEKATNCPIFFLSPLSDIMDLRHQSSATCIIILGGVDTHP